MSARRILVAAFGDAGHAFPAIALARALSDRGHDVVTETWEQWREPIEAEGLRFRAAEQYEVFPPSPGPGAGPAQAALALQPLFDEFRPELTVSDVLTIAPTLAAELNGCRHATLVPHLFPVHEVGMPFFSLGMMPPRTSVGRIAWRAALPLLESGLRRGRRELNATRRELGLAAQERFHGGISEELVLVGTFPELEYPRRWPPQVDVCGPLAFEIPHPEIDLPAGSEPLVLIASSTAHDPQCRLIRRCFEALADEPVRIVATSNGHFPDDPIEVPANAELVGWLSYTQLMAAAELVVCHGGHGTVCRALGAGKPLLVSPAVGDMAENGARVQWAGAGLMLPSRLRHRAAVRSVVRELLGEPRYREAAERIAARQRPGSGAERACVRIEALLGEARISGGGNATARGGTPGRRSP